MKRTTLCLLAGSLIALPVAAKEPAATTLHYKPPPDEAAERPVAVEISFAPEGTDLAIHLTYDKLPWGEECKNRCANTTIFFDTDDNRATGLQLGADKPETGADLAVTVQGAREYREKSADVFLRARVRLLPDGITTPEHGEVIAELDNRHDPDRLKSEQEKVELLVDATNLSIPSGRTLRIIYHPPADKALEAKGKGLLAGSSLSPAVFEGGKSSSKKGKRRK